MKIILPIHFWIRKRNKKTKLMEDWKVLVWMNAYMHWHHHFINKIKKHYHELVKAQLNGEKFDTISPHYSVYVGNKLTDWGNVRSVIEKFVLDALVENWVIKNDTLDYVLWDSASYHLDRSNPRIEIDI